MDSIKTTPPQIPIFSNTLSLEEQSDAKLKKYKKVFSSSARSTETYLLETDIESDPEELEETTPGDNYCNWVKTRNQGLQMTFPKEEEEGEGLLEISEPEFYDIPSDCDSGEEYARLSETLRYSFLQKHHKCGPEEASRLKVELDFFCGKYAQPKEVPQEGNLSQSQFSSVREPSPRPQRQLSPGKGADDHLTPLKLKPKSKIPTFQQRVKSAITRSAVGLFKKRSGRKATIDPAVM